VITTAAAATATTAIAHHYYCSPLLPLLSGFVKLAYFSFKVIPGYA